jgi:hypothetical protein
MEEQHGGGVRLESAPDSLTRRAARADWCTRTMRSTNVRKISFSGLKYSACAWCAVTLTALIAGTFSVYAPYTQSGTSDNIASELALASPSATDCDARET